VDFEFAADAGQMTPGTLLRPVNRVEEAADEIVFFFHQTTNPQIVGRKEPAGMGGNADLAYGSELAARGYVAIGIDHPGFGQYHPNTYEFGYQSVTGQMVWNHLVLLSLLNELGIVGSPNVVCIGHSLGGTNAMMFAQYAEAVRLLACSGSATTFKQFANKHGGSLSRWSRSDKYMPNIKTRFEDDPDRMPFDVPQLLAAFAPHPLFLSSTVDDEIFPASGADECAATVRQAYAQADAEDRFRYTMKPGPHQFAAGARNEAYDFVDAMVAAGALE
jgi:pimeloyl-ACP methyl ester carboxylesterase